MTSAIAARVGITEHNRKWWTLGAMCFALFMIMLDNTVVNVALPSIQRSLNATTAGLEWTLNAYTLSFAVLLVTGGRLGDIFGRRRMFLFGVVVFGASSFMCGLAQSETWLVAARATQGIGAAFMMPATLSILTNTFPPEELGRAIGTWAGVSAMALAVGPVIGGLLTEKVSWQSIFFINIPVAIAAVAVTLVATRESRDENAPRKIDVPGILTISVGLTALVLALVQSNSWGWGSARVVGLFVLAAVALTAFIAIEHRTDHPMVDFRFFRSMTFRGSNVVAFIVSFSMMAMFFFIALYLQDILHYSPLQAGVRFLPATVVIMVVAPVSGRMADRIGPRPLMVAGLLTVAFALFWLTGITTSTGYGYLSVAFVTMGLGMGLVMSPMSTAAMSSVDKMKAGVASGILSMTRMIGSSFGVALMGAVVASLGRSRLNTLLPAFPASMRQSLASSLGSGSLPHLGSQLTTTQKGQAIAAAHDSFVYALSRGLYVGAAFALAGALIAFVTIAPRSATVPQEDVVAEAVGV
jgi:EmrB/QacA subfamily drug resistance transporter